MIVKDATNYLSLLDQISQEGITLTDYFSRQRQGIYDVLKDFGYGEIIVDSGKKYGFCKNESRTIQQTGGTPTVGTITLGQGYNFEIALPQLAEKISIGNGAILPSSDADAENGEVGGLLLSEKIDVIRGVIFALGFNCTFEQATAIAEEDYFNDENFEHWPDYTINGKVLTWVSASGISYIPYDLGQYIVVALVENGILTPGELEFTYGEETTDYVDVNTLTIEQVCDYVNGRLSSNMMSQALQKCKDLGFVPYDGICRCAFEAQSGGYYLYTFITTNTKKCKYNITKRTLSGVDTAQGAVYLYDYRNTSSNQATIKYRAGTWSSFSVADRSGTDPMSGYPSSGWFLYNLGSVTPGGGGIEFPTTVSTGDADVITMQQLANYMVSNSTLKHIQISGTYHDLAYTYPLALERCIEAGFVDLGGLGSVEIIEKDDYYKYIRFRFISIESKNIVSYSQYQKQTTEYGTVTTGQLSTTNTRQCIATIICVVDYLGNLTWGTPTITGPTLVENATAYATGGVSGAWCLNVGEYIHEGMGLEEQIGAVMVDESGSIRYSFPDWYAERKYINAPTIEHREQRDPILPLRVPNPDEGDILQDDAQEGEITDDELEDKTDSQEEITDETDAETDTPTDDEGTTPGYITPLDVITTGMLRIYNPSAQVLQNFAAWLWSNNVLENFQKLFQDPMQAIIGLNAIYVTPTVSTTPEQILVGNLQTAVSSNVVTSQYVNISCGSITINRYYNNPLDYIDTKIELYLPFAGIVSLAPDEVVGKTISITARVDILTGTVLYNIEVNGRLLYTHQGNCAVQLPLSGTNYTAIFSTLASIAGGAIKGAALGPAGAILGATGSTVSGAISGGFSQQVERSGSIGSNAGAMGSNIPFLIITRNKPYDPQNYQRFYGFPANTKATLSSLSGYVKVKDCRLTGINYATQTELEEIEQLLKEGVII